MKKWEAMRELEASPMSLKGHGPWKLDGPRCIELFMSTWSWRVLS